MGVAVWVWLTRLTGGVSTLLLSRPEAKPKHGHLGIGFVSSSLGAQRREEGREGRRSGVMGEKQKSGSKGDRQA